MVWAAAIPAALPHIRSGRLRALGVTGEKAIDTLPGVRPIREQGLPNYKVRSWYGLLAPGGTSPAIVNRIHAEVGRILAVPEVQATLRDQGWTTAHVPVADMTRQIHDGRREWKVVTERAGIRME